MAPTCSCELGFFKYTKDNPILALNIHDIGCHSCLQVQNKLIKKLFYPLHFCNHKLIKSRKKVVKFTSFLEHRINYRRIGRDLSAACAHDQRAGRGDVEDRR